MPAYLCVCSLERVSRVHTTSKISIQCHVRHICVRLCLVVSVYARSYAHATCTQKTCADIHKYTPAPNCKTHITIYNTVVAPQFQESFSSGKNGRTRRRGSETCPVFQSSSPSGGSASSRTNSPIDSSMRSDQSPAYTSTSPRFRANSEESRSPLDSTSPGIAQNSSPGILLNTSPVILVDASPGNGRATSPGKFLLQDTTLYSQSTQYGAEASTYGGKQEDRGDDFSSSDETAAQRMSGANTVPRSPADQPSVTADTSPAHCKPHVHICTVYIMYHHASRCVVIILV
jgi:hypothetical protein